VNRDVPVRLGGLVVVAGSLVAGVTVAGPGDLYPYGSLYPWWTWVLVAAGTGAWARADTAVALVLTVTGAAALAAVGPQMPDLFTAGSDLVFVPVAVATGLLVARLRRTPRGVAES
jgi:hypothetical protein